MIKFVSVIFIFTVITEAAFALSPDEEKLRALDTKIMQSVDKCLNSTGVNRNAIFYTIMSDTPLDDKTGCFLNCVFKELDLYKDNNMLDKDKIDKFLEPVTKAYKDNEDQAAKFTVARKNIDDCLATQKGGNDACAAAKTFGDCAITNLKKAGFYQ